MALKLVIIALKYIDMSLALRSSEFLKADGLMKKKDVLKHLRRDLEAEECATKALKLVQQPHWYRERLKLRVQNSHWQGALEDVNRILPIMPKFKASNLQMRAKAYIGLKRYADAERDLDLLIKTAPYSREYHQDRLKLYKLEGKKDMVAKEEAAIKGLGDGIDVDLK